MIFLEKYNLNWRNFIMIDKETMNLYIYSTGKINLNRWNKKDGFYIEDYSFYQKTENGVIANGKTLKECISTYTYEKRFSIKTLFSGNLSNEIIENFALSKEDTDFIIEFCKWADF